MFSFEKYSRQRIKKLIGKDVIVTFTVSHPRRDKKELGVIGVLIEFNEKNKAYIIIQSGDETRLIWIDRPYLDPNKSGQIPCYELLALYNSNTGKQMYGFGVGFESN